MNVTLIWQTERCLGCGLNKRVPCWFGTDRKPCLQQISGKMVNVADEHDGSDDDPDIDLDSTI